MNTTEKVQVTLDIDANELWSAVFGSGFESDPVTRQWLMDYEFVSGDWDEAGVVKVSYINEDEETEHKNFNAKDLAAALSTAMAKNYYHVPCGGKIDADFDNYDSCVGDILMQVMVYGEEVFA